MKLKDYLRGRSRKEFAEKIGTTENYINNLCSNSRYFPGRKLARAIEEESNGKVTIRELLYPDQT